VQLEKIVADAQVVLGTEQRFDEVVRVGVGRIASMELWKKTFGFLVI
jgi:hypothetical protein